MRYWPQLEGKMVGIIRIREQFYFENLLFKRQEYFAQSDYAECVHTDGHVCVRGGKPCYILTQPRFP